MGNEALNSLGWLGIIWRKAIESKKVLKEIIEIIEIMERALAAR